jgi:hypothetical protein
VRGSGRSRKTAVGPKTADCLRDTSDASRSKPGIQAAAILNVADGTVRSNAARERKNTPSVFCLWSATLSTIGSDLTYSDLSWNARRSARMSLPAKGTCLPHCVAIGSVDGIAIAVI